MPLSLDTAKHLAANKGGMCLSTTYKNSLGILTWKCINGHMWDASLNNIKNGKTWCPYCAGKRSGLDIYKKIAEEHGGKCLSTKYVNKHVKLSFICTKGHTWEANPRDIKNSNSWCPHCNSLLKKGGKRNAKRKT
jgi:thiol-disulfide isomerase/thioredoxin